MSDELKPCPHCGSATAPEISNCVELESCANFDECPCETHLCVVCSVHKGGCGACGGFAPSEEGAVLKWNTRAERTCRNVALGGTEAGTFDVGGVFRCSACGFAYRFSEMPYPFCPECGAKVVG